MREAVIANLFLFLGALLQRTSATIVLKPLSVSLPDLPAKSGKFLSPIFLVANKLIADCLLANVFGSLQALGLHSSGICGALRMADPLDACSSLHNHFGSNETERVKFALAIRGECSFEDKIRNAQEWGFRAVIVYDDRDQKNLIYMMVNPKGIKVHAVFVSKATGEFLKKYAQEKEVECCIYPSRGGTDWTALAISLISVTVLLVFLVIVLVTPRHWLRSNFQSKNIDTRMVEALPCFTFWSGRSSDSHCRETCAICLEDYKDGEVLKVLPCQHEFHSSCVDAWLTKWGTFCPVCKFDMKTKFAYS
ncbi:hypothetical protein K2173_006231 [Erythroxylum novogranatense]|uniref:RING-type domain-containing protein n=1 Tax=Erythroxylum novogranatense TaxID=1862640 RepID=A0AAV8TDL1_9ROSI|nr:hypothetical protein K2173_006231 [Erythroxylum novogranatense]